jgi:membrane protease YdiL (CAAX protease family)
MNRGDATTARIAGAFVFIALGLAGLYGQLIFLSQKGALPFSMENSVPGTILKAILRDFGPAVAAVIVTAFYQRGVGLKRLWLSVARWRASWQLYLLAFLGPMIVAGLVVSIGVMTGTLKRNPVPISVIHFAIVFLAMAILDGPLGEEVGWRGLLLPQLLRKMGPIAASITVGGIWWLWHVPLYLADGKISTGGDWIDFLIDTLALSTVFTWFFLRSGGSTLLAIILHNASNYSIYLLLINLWHSDGSSRIPSYTHTALLLILGAAAGTSLARHTRQSNEQGPAYEWVRSS